MVAGDQHGLVGRYTVPVVHMELAKKTAKRQVQLRFQQVVQQAVAEVDVFIVHGANVLMRVNMLMF